MNKYVHIALFMLSINMLLAQNSADKFGSDPEKMQTE